MMTFYHQDYTNHMNWWADWKLKDPGDIVRGPGLSSLAGWSFIEKAAAVSNPLVQKITAKQTRRTTPGTPYYQEGMDVEKKIDSIMVEIDVQFPLEGRCMRLEFMGPGTQKTKARHMGITLDKYKSRLRIGRGLVLIQFPRLGSKG